MISMLDQQQTWVVLALVAATAVLVSKKNKQRLPYPPGPAGLPIIGNMLDMPNDVPWETYAQWGKEYGQYIVCFPGVLLPPPFPWAGLLTETILVM